LKIPRKPKRIERFLTVIFSMIFNANENTPIWMSSQTKIELEVVTGIVYNLMRNFAQPVPPDTFGEMHQVVGHIFKHGKGIFPVYRRRRIMQIP
jgi:hypothetical protein